MIAELGPEALRWTASRRVVVRPAERSGPWQLWGQDRLLEELEGGQGPLALITPGWADWVGPVAELVGGVAAHEGSDRALRGTEAEPGPLARANGGTLVIDVRDLAGEAGGWPTLRTALRSGEVRPGGVDGSTPAPRPARFRLILLGPDNVQSRLRDSDSFAASLIRRRLIAWPDLDRDADGQATAAARIAAAWGEPLGPSALVWLLEDAAARARRGRISLDVGRPLDLLAEARRVHPGRLDATRLRAAAARLDARRGFAHQNQLARLGRGQLRVLADGTQRGVVNGLMVYGGGKAPYVMPGRLSARAAIGREGLQSTERDAKYSGRSFDKGVLQLLGFLRATFAQRSPLALVAGLTFEQSYGKVDGDSATLAEAISLLSDLSQLPARQDIAVTGGLNQRGEVLPIGSATLKVIGWFRACQTLGLTGTQGVLLPERSAPDLQLPEDLVDAVAAGRFHVWTADHLDDALELLLGRPAGRTEKGFVRGSVYARAGHRLNTMAERLYPQRKKTEPEKPT